MKPTRRGQRSCFPSYEAIAEAAGCARSTLAEAPPVSTVRGISSLWGVQFSHLAGTAINRLSDQDLRFLAVDRDA
jgi:hypothetical protein